MLGERDCIKRFVWMSEWHLKETGIANIVVRKHQNTKSRIRMTFNEGMLSVLANYFYFEHNIVLKMPHIKFLNPWFELMFYCKFNKCWFICGIWVLSL